MGRLRLSLEQAARTGKKLIGLMHYPPFALGKQPSAFTELFQQYGAECVVYGHLHGRQIVKADYEGVEIGGVPYYLTSCDYLDFALRRIR